MKGWPWLWFVWLLLISASPRTAWADSGTTTSLGVRSLDGEDQLERRISAALRSAARNVGEFRLSENDVSLAQMSIAHGCDEVDNHCLADIAETLSSERLLYGTTTRAGAKLRITLFNFNRLTGQVESTAERSFPEDELVEPTLTANITKMVERLAGRASATGALRIRGNRPGSTVYLDDVNVGELDADGELLIRDVGEGRHTVQVATSDGREKRDLGVEVRADTTTTLRALLTPPLTVQAEPMPQAWEPESTKSDNPGRARRIVGYTSLGVAVGLAAATIYSWVRINRIAKGDDLHNYATLLPSPDQPGGVSDACAAALDRKLLSEGNTDPTQLATESRAHDVCSQAHKLESLQYVFLGGTLLTSGLGAYLLLTAPKPEKSTSSVSFHPSVGRGHASFAASLRF